MLLFQRMNTLTLPLITNLIPPEPFEGGDLEELLKQFADDVFTGVASFSFIGQNTKIGIFARGGLVSLNEQIQGGVRSIDLAGWHAEPADQQAMLQYAALSLHVQDLRLLKVMLESRIQSGSSKSKLQALAEAGKTKTPSIVACTSESGMALWTFPGNMGQCKFSLFVSDEQIIHVPGLEVFDEEIGVETAAWAYLPDADCLAWQELALAQFFSSIVLRMFNLIEQFKGRVLLNRIIKTFNFKAEANGWMVSVNARDMADQSMFGSKNQMVEAYQGLLSTILPEFITEIGKPILDGIVFDLLAAYPDSFWSELRSLLDSASSSQK